MMYQQAFPVLMGCLKAPELKMHVPKAFFKTISTWHDGSVVCCRCPTTWAS